MIAAIEVVSQITVDINDGEFTLKGTDVSLGVTPNVDVKGYFDEDEYPNQQGCALITRTLVSALSGNIKVAHQKGYINDAAHLRAAIKQLEEMFVIPDTEIIYVDEKEVNNG